MEDAALPESAPDSMNANAMNNNATQSMATTTSVNKIPTRIKAILRVRDIGIIYLPEKFIEAKFELCECVVEPKKFRRNRNSSREAER